MGPIHPIAPRTSHLAPRASHLAPHTSRPAPRASRIACRMSPTFMHADLERVIALQRLDSEAGAARKKLADAPERERAFEARLETARQQLAEAKAKLAANGEARRATEKEVALHQG